MKKEACLVMIVCCAVPALAAPYYFQSTSGKKAWIEVDAWAGSGTNETILVVDWNFMGGPYKTESHAFGFRWNGTAYESDMLNALDDAGLFTVTSGFDGAFLLNLAYNDGTDAHLQTEEGSWNLASTADPYAQWGAMSADWTKLGDWDANQAGYNEELLHDGCLEGINAIFWFGSYPDGKTIDDYPLNVPFATAPNPTTLDPFEDVQFWAGSGTNRAALVIDWKDGKAPQSFLWGYRWNGTNTGLDMLKALVAADSRLFAHLGQFGWGTAIFGIGYDLNNRGGLSVKPPLGFDAGGLVTDTEATNASDARVPSDSTDHFLEGWNMGFWAYFTKATQGDAWASSWVGAGDRVLSDGVWDGYTFAAGFVSSEPVEPVPAVSNPFAVEVVAAQGPFGASPYDDPASLLGMPSTNFYDPWGGWSGGTTERRVKLVEPAYHFLDTNQTHRLITTLQEGSSVVVRFEEPIQDDPAHPYGVDFLVFGNAFYTGSGFVNDSTDMNTYILTGGGFFEPMKVSVSPGYTGRPGQSATNWQTWDWYRFDKGPYADTAFPTHAYLWNRTNATWSSELMDFTKPVNPVLGPVLASGDLCAADAIDLYDGSGGGTGFDLAESGFTSIQYVKVEGLAGFDAGEIDAFSRVRPTVLGESLCIAPANLLIKSVFHFQEPGSPARNVVQLEFNALGDTALASVTRFQNENALAAICGKKLEVVDLELARVIGTNTVAFDAAVVINVAPHDVGGGTDLDALAWDGTNWTRIPFEFDAGAKTVRLENVGAAGAFAVVQNVPPQLVIHATSTGFDIEFTPWSGWRHTLERTVDWESWADVASITPTNTQPVVLSDSAPPEARAFYRLRLSRP